MLYGVCGLSAIPMRREPSDPSEMTNQVLFGETLTVLDRQKKWSLVKLAHDSYEGWIDNKQYLLCDQDYFEKVQHTPSHIALDMIEIVAAHDAAQFFPVFLGSLLPLYSANGDIRIGNHPMNYKGEAVRQKADRGKLVEYAYQYLNAPYLWGGRTPFGLDCSGFTQMVYRLGGYQLPRDAHEQATHGLTLSFIEESEPGDLAFFDNEEGRITHVGIILSDNFILHASGSVRLDRLDQTGIFNRETSSHTHKLRVIKKML